MPDLQKKSLFSNWVTPGSFQAIIFFQQFIKCEGKGLFIGPRQAFHKHLIKIGSWFAAKWSWNDCYITPCVLSLYPTEPNRSLNALSRSKCKAFIHVYIHKLHNGSLFQYALAIRSCIIVFSGHKRKGYVRSVCAEKLDRSRSISVLMEIPEAELHAYF